MAEEEILDATLRASGYPGLDEMTRRRWLDCSRSFDEMNFLGGFGWPDGRFRFRPEWAQLGPLGKRMPRHPGHWEVLERADERFPFRLITPPARSFLNTSFTETPHSREREKAPCVTLHPDDAAELGVTGGARVILGNDRGEVRLGARLSDGVQRGVVYVEGIWPGDAFFDGRGINHLTSAEAVAPAGGARFHDVAVWIRAK